MNEIEITDSDLVTAGDHQQPADLLNREEMPSIIQTASSAVKRLSKHEKKALKAQRLIEASKEKYKRYKERKKAEKQAKLLLENEKIDAANGFNLEPVKATESSTKSRKEIEEKLQKNLETGLNVCIELGYDEDIHSNRERSSLCKQLSLSYGYLKRTEASLHIHLTSFRTESLIYPMLQKQGVDGWKVDKHTNPAIESFAKQRLIFLSPDATDVLTDFENDKVYVIGGIVDRSVKKNLTLNQANTIGIQSYRLPIQEYIPQRVTHVLNVDHMIQIIGEFQLNKDWRTTLEAIVPKRKQIMLKNEHEDAESEDAS